MKLHRVFTGLLLLFLTASILKGRDDPAGDGNNWTHWRGPHNTGAARGGNPPLEWSETHNIKWKSEIPGTGHATPIVWEDRLILLSAVQTEKKKEGGENEEPGLEQQWMSPVTTDFVHRFVVISVNRDNGSIIWQTTVREELPFSHTHEFGSWASNSPVTDGEYIYAYFGSHGLYCLDMTGRIRWERDLGRMEKVMSFGEGSSPVLHKEKLVVLRDHEGQSTLHVLDKYTGKIIWEMDRDEVSSWSTPLVVEYRDQVQLITSATGRVRGQDLDTGDLIWECSGMTRNVIPSPVYSGGLVYVMSGFRGNALFAIDLSKASGDITGTDAIVFHHGENTPYAPGPALAGERLYFLKGNNGYLTCMGALDGKVYYSNQKLEGINNIFASPLATDGRVYITGTDGTTCVVKQGNEFELLARNELDDSFYASPVVIGEDLYLRGTKSLYCISLK